ncbi:MAG: hypothetical protein ACJASZ_002886 [Yoonia sp.]|jgi:hypothetical protein
MDSSLPTGMAFAVVMGFLRMSQHMVAPCQNDKNEGAI